MLTFANYEKHRGLSFTEDIHNIIQPLIELCNINYFHFFKIYPNNTCFSIPSDPEWTKIRFKMFKQGSLQNPHELKKNYQLWDLIEPANSKVFLMAKEYFNIWHGITLMRIQPDNSFEFFHFATNSYNPSINHFYISNIALLEHFADYFKDRAQSLIKVAELDKIHYPNVKSIYLKEKSETDLMEKFIKRTPIKKYHLSLKKCSISITSHEKEILKYFSEGLSAKEISIIMASSYRTVQTQIAQLKTRLGCLNKADIRKIFSSF